MASRSASLKEPVAGLEPAATSLQERCSTYDELNRLEDGGRVVRVGCLSASIVKIDNRLALRPTHQIQLCAFGVFVVAAFGGCLGLERGLGHYSRRALARLFDRYSSLLCLFSCY